MFTGKLQAIFVSAESTQPLVSVAEVDAVAGRGLSGDRYFLGTGTFTKPDEPDRQVTLIEAEALAAIAAESNLPLAPGASRRNLVTTGVPLNHLVGETFRVGDALMRGIRLCEPCSHLEKLTQKGVAAALHHRGGLRAEILRGGKLRPGDAVELASAE